MGNILEHFATLYGGKSKNCNFLVNLKQVLGTCHVPCAPVQVLVIQGHWLMLYSWFFMTIWPGRDWIFMAMSKIYEGVMPFMNIGTWRMFMTGEGGGVSQAYKLLPIFTTITLIPHHPITSIPAWVPERIASTPQSCNWARVTTRLGRIYSCN